MKANVIQTGSRGNCVILDDIIALDMGVAYKKVEPFVRRLQLVFISHEHCDHILDTTIWRLAHSRPTLRFACGDFLASKLVKAGVQFRNIDIIYPGQSYDYGEFKIEPFPLYHDVPNYGLKIYKAGEKAVYIVDTGFLDGIEAKDFDLYLLEANHYEAEIKKRMEEKLEAGQFSYELRASENHLSWEQAADWYAENRKPDSVWIPLHKHEERQDNGREKNVHSENH